MLTQAELNWLILPSLEWLTDSTIQRVYSSTYPFEWCLQMRRPGETRHLLICTDPNAVRIYFSQEGKPRQPQHPSTFTMLLRKWLQGMVIHEINYQEHERLIALKGSVRDPRHDDPDSKPERITLELLIELFGRHANIFLLDENRTILGQASSDRLPGRSLKPGKTYQPPDADPFDADHDRGNIRFVDQEPLSLTHDLERHHATEEWFNKRLKTFKKESIYQALSSRLKRHSKKLKRLVQNLEQDLARVEEAQRWKHYGELLQSAYGRVKKGAKHVRVQNYYEEGMPEVDIPLDPTRSLQANIDHYFKQYKRLHNAQEQIETRLLEKMELLDEVNQWRSDLRQIIMEEEEGWQDLEETLSARGLLGPPKQRPQQRSKQGQVVARPPYRCYTGSKGSKIFVGKGAKGNDTVSLKIARGRDIWLHARNWSGAHVIIRMDRNQKQAHQGELLEAAMLAAHFSKGKNNGKVEVTYTEAKYVRKPKGYPKGMVTVAGGSTLLIEIEPQKLERIMSTEHEEG